MYMKNLSCPTNQINNILTMKNKHFFKTLIKKTRLSLVLFSSFAFSQVTYVGGPTNAQINAAIIGSNITITGGTLNNGVRNSQIATFTNGLAAGLEINNGAFFGTGINSLLLATNNTIFAGGQPAGGATFNDANLTAIDSNANHDVVSYSFTVTLGPKATTLNVRYQFGSEEFPDYVGTQYDDAFGFFVTGPGIAGTANLARLPNGNPTSINKVNYGVPGFQSTSGAPVAAYDGSQSSLYLNNGHPTTIAASKLVENDNSGPKPIAVQFNGITKAINYTLSGLTPNGVYTFKIIIADSFDDRFDSGVFVNSVYATATLVANNDAYNVATGTASTVSVLNNDTVNGVAPATLTDVVLSQVSTTNAGVTLNPATGLISVAPGTPPGVYNVTYQICDQTFTSNCKTAVATVTVPTPFGCTPTLYLSQNTTTALFTINTATNPATYPQIGPISGISYNAMGLRPADGFIYAMVSNTNNLARISNDGSVTNLGAITGLPTGNYIAGEISNSGVYYVKLTGSNTSMYSINIATLTATPITLSAAVNVYDMAYSIVTGLLYGVNMTNGQLVSISTTGTVTTIGGTFATTNFGAMYAASTGEIYGNLNDTGGFYQFNITNGQRTLILNSPASNINDGAHCVTQPIIFSGDLAVTKTDGATTFASGTSKTYTIVVSNNGPIGVTNATVSDPVPSGVPAGNVSYTAAVAGGASTSVVGTQTGAISDVITIPVGGTVTYTVVVTIPFGYSGNLVNTATVTLPSNINDTNTTNNTATDTDTQTVCYKPAVTVGTILDTPEGITALNRAGVAANNWPMVRKGAWIAMEAATKGFVLNRLTSAQITAIPAGELVEGMLIYNITSDCLMMNINGTPAGWKCLDTQTCPN